LAVDGRMVSLTVNDTHMASRQAELMVWKTVESVRVFFKGVQLAERL
jgi:hypothetical protein